MKDSYDRCSSSLEPTAAGSEAACKLISEECTKLAELITPAHVESKLPSNLFEALNALWEVATTRLLYLSQKQRIRSSHVSSTRLAKKLKVSNIPFTIICCNLLSDLLSGCMFSRAISISEKDSSTLAPEDNHPSGTRWWM